MKKAKTILISKGTKVWGDLDYYLTEKDRVYSVLTENDVAFLYEGETEILMVYKKDCKIIE